MRRSLLVLGFVLGSLVAGPLVDVAQACPMCKEANEADSNLPRAYMYSILFMLAVPASVVTGFGIGFYRLSREPGDEMSDEELAELQRQQRE